MPLSCRVCTFKGIIIAGIQTHSCFSIITLNFDV
nr:MAG TPA: hypothetical protein [Bacteriophage sp.]